jgi:hypothetical protein
MSPHVPLAAPDSEPDFLGRLVDRSFGLGEGVQPRVASLFEPATTFSPAVWDAEAALSNAESTHSEQESRLPPLDSHNRNVHPAARNLARGTETSEQPSRHEASAPLDLSDVVARSRSGILNAANAPALMSEEKGGALNDEHADRNPLHGSLAAATSNADDSSPPALPREIEPRQFVESRREIQRESVTGNEHPSQVGKLVVTLLPPTQYAAGEPPKSTIRSSREQAMTAPEPVINVTIGRVEVRAVSAAAPATRARDRSAEPHPMSLEEYLQRRGGRR